MFVHASRIRKHIDYLGSAGVDTRMLLASLDCSQEQLSDPDQVFSLEEYLQVLDFALEHSGDPYYGIQLGREPHIAGAVGMLCASCRNLEEAFIQGCKYFRMLGDTGSISFQHENRHPRIRYVLADAFMLKAPHLVRTDVEIMFSFLQTILDVNSNGKVKPSKICFQWPAPEGRPPYLEVFGTEPTFSAEYNEMLFRTGDLKVPMKAFDPANFEMLRTHVEKELRKRDHNAPVSDRVRSILLSSVNYTFPDMETVASRLNLGTRTLQRMLSREQTNFKSLRQDTRLELARQLLSRNELSISEISYTLGYSDVGNFSRSFKNKHGYSPQAYRERK